MPRSFVLVHHDFRNRNGLAVWFFEGLDRFVGRPCRLLREGERFLGDVRVALFSRRRRRRRISLLFDRIGRARARLKVFWSPEFGNGLVYFSLCRTIEPRFGSRFLVDWCSVGRRNARRRNFFELFTLMGMMRVWNSGGTEVPASVLLSIMDAKAQSSPPDNADVKAAFHKPSNDASNRNYRRHSPASNSSSSDGSPEHDRASSPKYARDDASKPPEYRERRKADEKDLYKDSGRSHYSRGGDSYKYADRRASRGSRGYSRIDEQTRHRMDEEERDHHKSTHGGRESRRGSHSDRTRRENDYSRSKDFTQDGDRYSRDKYDDFGHRSKDREKESGRRSNNFEETERDRRKRDVDDRSERRDYHRSSGDRRIDRTLSREESKGYHSSSTARKDTDGQQSKEGYRNDLKDRDNQKFAKEKKSTDDCDITKDKDLQKRGAEKHLDDATAFKSDKSSPTKRPRLFSSERDSIFTKDDDAKHSLDLKESQETSVKANEAHPHASGTEAANDLSVAKSAAMRAAEMVNKNLAGGFGPTGYLSTEQKKKLLWGNKKNTATVEPGHHWDVSMIAEPERQEKFSKLMGVKGELKAEPIANSQDGSSLLRAEKQKELQLDLEKQYTAGLRRRDGRTVGLGL